MSTTSRLLLAMLLVAFAPACSKATPEPTKETSAAPPASVLAAGGDAAAAHAGHRSFGVAPQESPQLPGSGPRELGWDAPARWESVPNANAMRTATFKVPRSAGDSEDAELAVSTAGGGTEANIDRWAGQFGRAEPKVSRRTVNGLAVTLVELRGTYASGGMGGPTVTKPRQALLGAIVDGDGGKHFFKLVGPERTVDAARADFDTFVGTLRAKR